MRSKLNEEDQKKIMDSVNYLMKLRQKKNGQIIPSTQRDNGDHERKVYENDFRDSLIVSKNYYDECISSDGDSADESIIKPNQLVYEINSESSSEDDSESSVSEQLQLQKTTIIDIPCKKDGVCRTDVDQMNENNEYLDDRNIDIFENNVVNEISFEMCTDSTEEIKRVENNDVHNKANLEKNTDITVENNECLRDDNFEKSKCLNTNEKHITDNDNSILCPVQNEETSHVLHVKESLNF